MRTEMTDGGIMVVAETEFELDYITDMLETNLDIGVLVCEDCGGIKGLVVCEVEDNASE